MNKHNISKYKMFLIGMLLIVNCHTCAVGQEANETPVDNPLRSLSVERSPVTGWIWTWDLSGNLSVPGKVKIIKSSESGHFIFTSSSSSKSTLTTESPLVAFKYLFINEYAWDSIESSGERSVRVEMFVEGSWRQLSGNPLNLGFSYEIDDDRVRVQGLGAHLEQMLFPNSLQKLQLCGLFPTNIKPTATTRSLIMEEAKKEFRDPPIWKEIVDKLKLTEAMIASNPELRRLLREAKAVNEQAAAADKDGD